MRLTIALEKKNSTREALLILVTLRYQNHILRSIPASVQLGYRTYEIYQKLKDDMTNNISCLSKLQYITSFSVLYTTVATHALQERLPEYNAFNKKTTCTHTIFAMTQPIKARSQVEMNSSNSKQCSYNQLMSDLGFLPKGTLCY